MGLGPVVVLVGEGYRKMGKGHCTLMKLSDLTLCAKNRKGLRFELKLGGGGEGSEGRKSWTAVRGGSQMRSGGGGEKPAIEQLGKSIGLRAGLGVGSRGA